ncbi:MAG: hypothetical protein V1933_01970, partial [Candidatus Omnitrophota bacterium]
LPVPLIVIIKTYLGGHSRQTSPNSGEGAAPTLAKPSGAAKIKIGILSIKQLTQKMENGYEHKKQIIQVLVIILSLDVIISTDSLRG